MISHDELLQTKREDILRIAAQYGAYNVRIFGSVARGEADSENDIDLLVNMEPGRSLLDLCGLLIDLEELLGRKVDVVTEKGLRDRIRERMLNEAIALREMLQNSLQRR
ncbi:MAG TPA: nucleotidyltransferase family protein [Ktedonobacteraceae bacterium]